MSTDTAFWAGLGVIGFTGLAFRMWQPPRDEEPLWSKWLDVAFWSYFAVGMVAMVIWHASRVGNDDGVEWPIVFLLGFLRHPHGMGRDRKRHQGLAGVTHPSRSRHNGALTVGAINSLRRTARQTADETQA